MPSAIIYSSATGGTEVQKKTESLNSLLLAKKVKATVVYLDVDAKDKQQVWDKSGKKGVYPLLFVDGEFVGDYDSVVTLNEEELLDGKLGIK